MVLIHVLIKEENLLIPQMNVFLLESIGLAKQVGDNSTGGIDSLELVTVAIGFGVDV